MFIILLSLTALAWGDLPAISETEIYYADGILHGPRVEKKTLVFDYSKSSSEETSKTVVFDPATLQFSVGPTHFPQPIKNFRSSYFRIYRDEFTLPERAQLFLKKLNSRKDDVNLATNVFITKNKNILLALEKTVYMFNPEGKLINQLWLSPHPKKTSGEFAEAIFELNTTVGDKIEKKYENKFLVMMFQYRPAKEGSLGDDLHSNSVHLVEVKED